MSGKPKQGIEYAPWSTDIFENDTKIDELIDAQGWIGFSIYFYLCQKAYSSDGYFYRWSYANAPTTARRMGGGIGSETVKQTVALCLRIGLFEKDLFDRENVLTSRGIQRRYGTAIQKRRVKIVEEKYWLLDAAETAELNLQFANEHLRSANDVVQDEDAYKSKVKEKESKERKNNIKKKAEPSHRFIPPTVEEVRAYCLERKNSIDPELFVDFYTQKNWYVGKNKMVDWKAAVRTWERNQAKKRDSKDGKTVDTDYEWGSDFFESD